MNAVLKTINYGIILIYGTVLTFSFVGAVKNKKDNWLLLSVILILGLIQLIFYLIVGDRFLFKIYPIVTHIPLFLLLIFYMKKPALLSLISVLSGYLFCTPRKWIGTCVALFFNNSSEVSYITQILITLPLLFIICKFISPYVVRLQDESKKSLKILVIVPLFYYVIEYALTVYTDLLYDGGTVVVEFMDSSIVILYFIFSILYIIEINKRIEIEIYRKLTAIKSDEAEKEIKQLRQSQQQAVIYRHDLRHHLQYISACIEQNETNKALEYIQNTCNEIDKTKVIHYCENETVNLILSSYISKAQSKNIHCQVDAKIGNELYVTQMDICSILSNAIENAIHACVQIPEVNKRFIRVRAYQQNRKFMIEIKNSCLDNVQFENVLPVTNKNGHGIGVKSIIAITEKYGGLYSFKEKDSIFVFRVVI